MIESISLKNLILNKVISLNMNMTGDFDLEYVDWGSIVSSRTTYKYINQIGEVVTSVSLRSREVVIIGWIVAASDLQMSSKKDLLNEFVNPLNEIELLYNNYSLIILPESTVRYTQSYKENNDVICKFKIEGIAPNPLFVNTNQNKIDISNKTAKFHFPLIFSEEPNPPGGVIFGYRQPSLIKNIISNGTIYTGIEIVFTAKGELTNPSLINVETQEFFKINKVMSKGEVITINTNDNQKKIAGAYNGVESNYFKYKDLNSSWLQLKKGLNSFRYDAESNLNNLDVTIYYKDKFMEVEQCF